VSREELLEPACRAFGAAASPAELEQAIDLWAPRFHHELERRMVRGSRPLLGMDVTRIPGWGGFTARRGDSFFVGVGAAGGREARFTFAHELAHVVLNSADRPRLSLDREKEEVFCNHFALRALTPPALIRADFAKHGAPRSLTGVVNFASRFRVSLRLSLRAIDEFLPAEWPVCFIAATWRTHPRGDEVYGLRVDLSASDDRLFVPQDCRLSTLGYKGLEAWALDADVGDSGSGAESAARLRSGRRGVSAWVGESRWAARRHYAPATNAADDRPAALCMLEVSRLSPQLGGRRRRALGIRDSTRPAAKLPGQLDLIGQA